MVLTRQAWPTLRRPYELVGLFGVDDVLRVEQFEEDDMIVIRVNMPDIDPDED